jgi:hypothetical protein
MNLFKLWNIMLNNLVYDVAYNIGFSSIMNKQYYKIPIVQLVQLLF